MKRETPPERKRDIHFAEKTITRIWQEEAAPGNPYLTTGCRCHGYDLMALMRKRSFVDVLFLLFSGELPSLEQAHLLESLMIAFINPGPRHPATRAAMNAGVGGTFPQHILPIALSVMGGCFLGAAEVEQAMRFLRKNLQVDPGQLAAQLLQAEKRPAEGDWHVAPGFGSRYGSIDPMPREIAKECARLPASGEALAWGEALAVALGPEGMGWVAAGVAAAVLCDLGFHPRTGAGLFQIICAPGLLAHGLELANKPITAMPFLDEEHYVIPEEARGRQG